MNAKRLPSGNYRVRLFINTDSDGKKHYKSFTAPTKKQAELLALQYSQKRKPDSITFEDAVEKYIMERKNVLSPATIRKYKSMQKAEYLSPIMPLKLNEIKEEDIQAIITRMSKERSPKTVRDRYGFIASVMKSNDCWDNMKITIPKKTRTQVYLPDDNDIKKLFKAVKGTSFEIPVYLAAIGCLRRAEICAFSKNDIINGQLHVHKEMVLDDNNKWVIKTPKSYKGDRFVPLPPFLIKKIKDMPGDTVGLTPNSITNRFGKILDKAGIKRFRFHDLRHYGASVLSKLGVNTYTIMTICGWEDERMLNEIYRYQFADELKNAAKLSSNYFNRMTRNMTRD